MRKFLVLTIFLIQFLSSFVIWTDNTNAGEGGSSHYNPGTNGDFAMALIGPAGWYVRNDLMYMDGKMGPVTRGRFELDQVSQEAWVNTLKTVYVAESGVFGGRFGQVLSAPIVLNVDVNGELAGSGLEKDGSRTGFADPVYTFFLNWHKNTLNYSVGLNTYIPLGYYDVGSIINLGRNYWSFDPVLSFTWLDPERGHEVSFISGIMLNTENSETDYQSGSEFHIEWNIAQHFSKSFGVGFIGYYYKQLSDDDGPLLDQLNSILIATGGKSKDGFRGEALGLGAAMTYGTAIGGENVTFIAKFIANVDNTNRLDNDYFMFSLALPL